MQAADVAYSIPKAYITVQEDIVAYRILIDIDADVLCKTCLQKSPSQR